jgi:hypothetical protein
MSGLKEAGISRFLPQSCTNDTEGNKIRKENELMVLLHRYCRLWLEDQPEVQLDQRRHIRLIGEPLYILQLVV